MAYTRGPILKHGVELVEKKKAKLQKRLDWHDKRGTPVFVNPGNNRSYQKFEGIPAIVLDQIDERQVLIQFDRKMEGLHNGNGKGSEDRCWFVHPKYLIIMSEAGRADLRPGRSGIDLGEQVKVTMKKKWNRGTLVRVKKGVGFDRYVGSNAYVLEQQPDDQGVLIQFEQVMHGLHDGDGKGRPGCCLWVGDRQIMSYWEPQKKVKASIASRPLKASHDDDESSWPDSLPESVKIALSQVEDEEERESEFKRNIARNLSIAMGEDVPDEPPEVELSEEVEMATPSGRKRMSDFAEHYRMAGNKPIYSTTTGVAVEAKPHIGQLYRIQKADGSITSIDHMPATSIAVGPFGRVLLQFDYRVPGGHSGKGKGEPGRCKWFYRKDLVPISLGEAALMDRKVRDDRGIGRGPKKKVAAVAPRQGSGGQWSPNPTARLKIRERDSDSSSESMWDIEDAPAPKKNVKARLPSITTSGKLIRGCKVIVRIAPSDNEYLKGKQGTIISDSGGGSTVTVEFDDDIRGGHCGTGAGRNGRCWNIGKSLLKIVDTNVVFYIKENYKRGGKNLKGMEVKVLAHITHPTSESSSVVEFTEEIPKGHSADGKGKKAHCLTIPVKIIGKKKKEEPKRVKTPHEVTAAKGAKKK